MSSTFIAPDGLRLLDYDELTDEELAQFRAYYSEHKGPQNRSYEFWMEFRPDVLKRHKARTRQWSIGPTPLVSALAAFHQYVVTAFEDGIEYELRLSQTAGATREDLIDTLSIAFIHSSHPGMYLAANQTPYLRTYEAHPVANRFPEHWDFDPLAFSSGMDFSTLEASPGDIELLEAWYEKTIGEVPKHVRFLAQFRPDLLKAYRNRYEHAIRDSLPKQMMPYLMLNYEVFRGSPDGIRENVLLAKAFGMVRREVLDAICSAVLHAGATALNLVNDTVGQLLLTIPDD